MDVYSVTFVVQVEVERTGDRDADFETATQNAVELVESGARHYFVATDFDHELPREMLTGMDNPCTADATHDLTAD